MKNEQEILEQFKNARKISMTAAEKQSMRSHLEELVRAGASAPHMADNNLISDIRKSQVSPYFGNMFKVGILARAMVFVLVGFIVGGTTLSFASANTLPGDALYSIKTKVIEPVRRSFAFSVESTARYDASLVQTRIDEIQKLEDSGKLSDPRISVIAEASMEDTFDGYAKSLGSLKNRGHLAQASKIATETLGTIGLTEQKEEISPMAVSATMSMTVSSTRMMKSEIAPPMAKKRGRFKNEGIDSKLESLSLRLEEFNKINSEVDTNTESEVEVIDSLEDQNNIEDKNKENSSNESDTAGSEDLEVRSKLETSTTIQKTENKPREDKNLLMLQGESSLHAPDALIKPINSVNTELNLR